jgi:hypothetical protein
MAPEKYSFENIYGLIEIIESGIKQLDSEYHFKFNYDSFIPDSSFCGVIQKVVSRNSNILGHNTLNTNEDQFKLSVTKRNRSECKMEFQISYPIYTDDLKHVLATGFINFCLWYNLPGIKMKILHHLETLPMLAEIFEIE